MDQILHIFKKDVRRHWPEILSCLAILALFTRHELHPWTKRPDSYGFSTYMFFYSGRVIIPALVIAWTFLIIRVIQSETLIGDRQWWITKPYEWWKLLLAKLLFIFVFISVPLYHSQLFLLHKAGFPVLPYLWSVVLLQISLPCVLIFFSILLACLTRNLGQAVLTIGILVAAILALAWLASLVPGESMSRHTEASQDISDLLIFSPLLLAPIWQFARRKTWQIRGLVCAAFLVSVLFGIFLPNGGDIDKFYPSVAAKDAPVQISLRAFAPGGNHKSAWSSSSDTVNLVLPVSVSGVAPGSVVLIDGINVKADSQEASRWNRGWNGQYLQIWPEDQRKELRYVVNRKDYERLKSNLYNLRIEIAFSEYQSTEARTLRVSSGIFSDQVLGTCRLSPIGIATIQCLKPIRTPGYMARFDGANSPCAGEEALADRDASVSYVWQHPNFDFLPDANLNPVVDYNLWFSPVARDKDNESERTRRRNPMNLCGGADIWLARPVFKRQFRVELNLPNTRLLDLAEYTEYTEDD
jgi:hypothetical protein